jgi:hypothetical protein
MLAFAKQPHLRQDQEGEPVTAQRPQRSRGPAAGGLTGEGAQLPFKANKQRC